MYITIMNMISTYSHVQRQSGVSQICSGDVGLLHPHEIEFVRDTYLLFPVHLGRYACGHELNQRVSLPYWPPWVYLLRLTLN